MSYMLQVFQPPQGVRPLRPGDVAALVDSLHGQSPPANPAAFGELVRLVKASASPAQRGEWLEALAADGAGPVLNLAVETGRADQLVALVVRCARTLKLAVLDEQAAIAYWPDGAEIRFPARRPAPDLPDAMDASQQHPVQLPAGQDYLLYCGHFSLNEGAMAEQLPEMLAKNTRHPNAQSPGWLLALDARLERQFGRQATADGIWAQELAAAEGLSFVMPLAVKAERIRQARPRILQIAHSVGLSVFDPQAMQVHFPDGHICWRGAHWNAPWFGRGPPDPDLMPLEVAALLAPMLEPHGFVADGKGKLVRGFAHLTQTIVVYGSHWDVSVNVWIEVALPTDLPVQASPTGQPETKDSVGIWGRLAEFVGERDFDEPFFLDRQGNRMTVNRQLHVGPLADEIGRVLVERVVPYYDARSSVQALHAAVNGPGAAQQPAWPLLPSTRLAIARMAGEPRLHEMAAHELEQLRAWTYNPDVRGLNRTEWQRELPKVEALLEWLGGMGRRP